MKSQWAITVPKSVKWSDYRKELKAAEAGAVLNYRVRYKPKGMSPGDLCFVVWDGSVRGYHIVSGVEYKEAFVCSTTGVEWRAGWYVQRTGKFIAHVEPMIGFRGIRRVHLI